MKIENKRKCKNLKALHTIEFGEVFRNGEEYFIATDDSCVNGADGNTLYCVSIETGELQLFCADDEFEVVKAKVVIE